MKSKWSLAFWAVLVCGAAMFYRHGVTPTTIATVLCVGGVAFAVGWVIEYFTGGATEVNTEVPKDVPISSSPAAPTRDPNAPPAPPGAISLEPMNQPPIPLDGPPPTKPAPPKPHLAAKKDDEIKDSFRELIETVVFVVVLVLMLKTFLAEAFVIPTGSMATTLLGYHYKLTCPQCGYPNLVNASAEAEPPAHVQQRPQLQRWQCINCKHTNEPRRPDRGLPP